MIILLKLYSYIKNVFQDLMLYFQSFRIKQFYDKSKLVKKTKETKQCDTNVLASQVDPYIKPLNYAKFFPKQPNCKYFYRKPVDRFLILYYTWSRTCKQVSIFLQMFRSLSTFRVVSYCMIRLIDQSIYHEKCWRVLI